MGADKEDGCDEIILLVKVADDELCLLLFVEYCFVYPAEYGHLGCKLVVRSDLLLAVADCIVDSYLVMLIN